MSRCNSKISQQGVVIMAEDGRYRVSIEPIAACRGCSAKGACGTDGGSKVIDIVGHIVDGIEIGDRVEVSVRRETAFYATFFAYILPVTLFIASIFIGVMTIGDEGLAALLAFVVIALYYGGLYYSRSRVERAVRFEIKKKFK